MGRVTHSTERFACLHVRRDREHSGSSRHDKNKRCSLGNELALPHLSPTRRPPSRPRPCTSIQLIRIRSSHSPRAPHFNPAFHWILTSPFSPADPFYFNLRSLALLFRLPPAPLRLHNARAHCRAQHLLQMNPPIFCSFLT